MADVSFIDSKRGGKLLIYESNLYRIANKLKDKSYWKCASENGCKARVTLKNDKYERSVGFHTHEPQMWKIKRKMFTENLSERAMEDPTTSIPQIYREELEKIVSNDLKTTLPSFNTVKKRMYDARALSRPSLLPRTLKAKNSLHATDNWTQIKDDNKFLVDNKALIQIVGRKGLLDRLKEGVVIGDGGFVFSLEKRGYVKAGPWTPEAAVEHPEAVRNLHREFLRAGSDVMQAFTFYASDDKLINRGNEAGKKFNGNDINEAACKIAREVANEGDALVAGGISQTPTYLSGKGKASVQAEFRKQVEVFVKNKVDFLICEYFEHIEEMTWAIEVCKETDLPVAATMCIGSEGDMHGITAGECAVKMAKAGAHVVGLNCHFDPFRTLETIAVMKLALDAAGLKPYLMTQPLALLTPDAGKQGFIDLPEFPFALEPRVCTRWDMHRYAREAYALGVRYIGGCCGFESYHIRAVSEELVKERGKLPTSSEKHDPWGEGLRMHTKPWVRARARRSYWEDIKPSTGRPQCAAFSSPDNWGVTAGSEDLKQKTESTTNEELQKMFARASGK